MGLEASVTPQNAEKHEILENFQTKNFWGGRGSPTPNFLYGIPKGSIGLLRGGFLSKKKFRETSKKWAAYGSWTPQVRPICPLQKNRGIRNIWGHSLYGKRLKKNFFFKNFHKFSIAGQGRGDLNLSYFLSKQ